MSFLDEVLKAPKLLRTTGADVNIGDSAPPAAGQVLVAIDATHAEWHDQDGTNDATARAAAAAAQSTANSASSAAAAAQTTANSGVSAAAAAQLSANAAQTTANAAVPKSLYDANTILAATTDDTPAALTVAASTVLGRKASGNITAMSSAETKVVLSLDSVTNDAQTKAAISGYTAKTPVLGADLLYIGDSAASNAIKRATLADVVALTPLTPGATGNPYIDISATPSTFDDEFNSGSADLSVRGYTVKTASGTVLTRGGGIAPWDATGPVGNTYWSTLVGSWLLIQCADGVQVDISKTVALVAGDTYYARIAGTYNLTTAGGIRYCELGFYGVTGGALDNNNRVYNTLKDANSLSAYLLWDIFRTTAGANSGNTYNELGIHDVRGMHFASGTTHHSVLVNSGSGQILTQQLTGTPVGGTLTQFAIRNRFSAASSIVPQILAIDYIRKKSSDNWIAG